MRPGGTRGHTSVQNMTRRLQFSSKTTHITKCQVWGHFLRKMDRALHPSLMSDEPSKPLLFKRAKWEAQTHEEWEKWGDIELFWLIVQGSLRERPRVVVSPTFWESLGAFYPGTVQYFWTCFHPEWGKRGLKRRHSNLTVGTSRWKTRRALRYVICLSCARHCAWYVLPNSPTLPACYRE